MAFDGSALSYDNVTTAAIKIAQRIRSFHGKLQVAKTDVQADNYGRILANINDIRTFEGFIQQIIAAGVASQVAQKIVDIYNNQGVTLADLNGFRSALNAIRSYIRDNSAEFAMTYDSNDNFQFVTPPSAPVKTELLNRIDSALAIITA